MDETHSTPTQTNILDLPNELLLRILAQKSLEDDLWKVQLVCRRWRAIITESIGFAIQVNATSMRLIQERNWTWPTAYFKSFNAIEDFAVKTLFVDWKDCAVEKMMSSLKHPHLLEHLHLEGCIKPEIFTALLNGVKNLKVLELNLWGLYEIKPCDIKNLHLPQLKILRIRGSEELSVGAAESLSLPNFKLLLIEGSFPSLSELGIEFPLEKAYDLNVLLNFFKRHTHLRKLHVTHFCKECGSPDNLEDLWGLLPQLKLQLKQLKTTSLQVLKIDTSACPQVMFWNEFLTQQENLKSLDLSIGFITKELLEDICAKNKSSLESIFLYEPNRDGFFGRHGLEYIFDGGILVNMTHLQTLQVYPCDRFLNLTGLPSTLETIVLSGAIKTDEVGHIMLNLPNLKFIHLTDASGKKEGCGVSANILREFIAKRNVRRLLLRGYCCNEELPPEGLSNGGPYEQIMVQSSNNIFYEIYLYWELDETRSFYIQASHPGKNEI